MITIMKFSLVIFIVGHLQPFALTDSVLIDRLETYNVETRAARGKNIPFYEMNCLHEASFYVIMHL